MPRPLSRAEILSFANQRYVQGFIVVLGPTGLILAGPNRKVIGCVESLDDLIGAIRDYVPPTAPKQLNPFKLDIEVNL